MQPLKPDLKETVILVKGNRLAFIGFNLNPDGGIVFSAELQTKKGVENQYYTAKETWEKFEESLAVSESRGWRIKHRGEPNYG